MTRFEVMDLLSLKKTVRSACRRVLETVLSYVHSTGPILLLTMAEYFAKNPLNISLEYVVFHHPRRRHGPGLDNHFI